MVTQAILVQDVLYSKSGKKMDKDIVLPFVILPGLFLVSTFSFIATIIVLVAITMAILYVLSRPMQKNRSPFFFMWTISSIVYLFLVFNFGVLKLFVVNHIEMIVLLLLLGATHYSFYKLKYVADNELAIGPAKGKEYSPVLTADSKFCHICQIEVNERLFHSIWWDCCVIRANYGYYLAGQVLALMTLILGIDYSLTTVCESLYLINNVLLIPSNCDNVYISFKSSLIYATSLYALGYACVILLVLLQQCFVYIPRFYLLLIGRPIRPIHKVHYKDAETPS